jgi:hypothetical protein
MRIVHGLKPGFRRSSTQRNSSVAQLQSQLGLKNPEHPAIPLLGNREVCQQAGAAKEVVMAHPCSTHYDSPFDRPSLRSSTSDAPITPRAMELLPGFQSPQERERERDCFREASLFLGKLCTL